jgi:transposase
MPKKYSVKLTASERRRLETLVEQRRGSARQQRRMQALLLSAEGCSDEEVAEEVGLHVSSLERLRKRFVEVGVGNPRAPTPGAPLLDAKQEAVLISLAFEKPTNGQVRWSLRQLGSG